MTPIILESPPVAGEAEELTLDGLALHSSPYRLVGFEHKPAKKLLEWVKGADADGAKLLRLARHEQAEIQLQLRLEQQATMDAALGFVGDLVDKLQEAERQAAGGLGRGLELVWSPAGSSFTGKFYVQAGEIDVPKAPEASEKPYLWRRPIINLVLTCDPFIYGEEVANAATVTSSLPLITLAVSDVPGDVSAEARVTITDAAGQARDFVVIGLQNLSYDAGTSLLVDSDDLVVSGMAGSTTSATGAYDPNATSPTAIQATLTTTPVAVCSTGELGHKGSYRVIARVWGGSTGVRARLAWRQGRDQWTAEPFAELPVEDEWCEVDLGQIRVREALLGTQSWQGRIEAKSETVGDLFVVDYLALVPSGEGYGKARKTLVFETPTTFSARDEFDQSAGALTGKTAPAGGVWVGAGDADDFSVETTGKTAQRTAVSDADANTGRYVVSGVAAFAAQVVQVDHKRSTYLSPSAEILTSGVLARYTDTSNYLLAAVEATSTTSAEATYMVVKKRVAGTVTELARVSLDGETQSITAGQRWWTNTFHTLMVMVDVAGRWWVWWGVRGGIASLVATGQDSVLATGGALASGKPGFYDAKQGGVALTRNYDNFLAFAATRDAVIFSGQSMEFRSYGDDPVLREDSTGTYWGRPPETRGGRLWLPPAGDQDRTTRIAVLARRNDIETQRSDNVTDSTTVAASLTPRYLVVPRSA